MTKASDCWAKRSHYLMLVALPLLLAGVGCDNESKMIREARIKSSKDIIAHDSTHAIIPVIDTTRPGVAADWYVVNVPDEWKDNARFVLWCNFRPVGLINAGAKRGTARITWGEEISTSLTHNQIEFGLSVVVDDKLYYFYSKNAYYLRDTIDNVSVFFTPNEEQKVSFELQPKSVFVH